MCDVRPVVEAVGRGGRGGRGVCIEEVVVGVCSILLCRATRLHQSRVQYSTHITYNGGK